MSTSSDVNQDWKYLNKEGNDEIKRILEKVNDDNRAITVDTASKGMQYLRELNENSPDYEIAQWFHGTKSLNIESILEDGLVPGSENESPTGEKNDHDSVCLGKFGLALNYAKEGTPKPDQIRHHVDRAYENGIVEHDKNNAPDISTQEGREEFFSDTEDTFWSIWNPLPKAVENYEEIVEAAESDPIVIGVTGEMMEPVPEKAEEYKHKNEIELSSENRGLTEMRTSEVTSENMYVFVPHEDLDSYREEYGDRARILSIEAMQMKLDHENRVIYQEEGTLDYRGVWNSNTEYPFTIESNSRQYNPSTLVPDAPE